MTTTPPIPIVARLREWIKPQTNANAGLNWDLEEAADTIEALLDALLDTTAHLVAATSLLERGGKKAAPSDKMFAQMLADYQKSAEVGRAAIAKARGQS
jgi:hypothetical protein